MRRRPLVFLQYATKEDFLTPERAREYFAIVSEPKALKFYEAPHALNAEARRDRIAFLVEELNLKPPIRQRLRASPSWCSHPRLRSNCGESVAAGPPSAGTTMEGTTMRGCPILRALCEDSLFPVKQFFLSGEVQENLSLFKRPRQVQLRGTSGSRHSGCGTEHAEDGVQDFTGDGDQGLEFGFAACD